MPANIRFKFYQTLADIKIENRFSALPIKMPLVSNMKDAYGRIKKITTLIK